MPGHSLMDNSEFRSLLLKVFEGVNRDLEFTLEMPEDFPDSWLPTLDTSLKLEGGKIVYRYFEKPMASKFCLMRRSAISWNTKRASLTQEVRRRTSNTYRDLDEDERDKIFLNFLTKLETSGYARKEARDIIKDGLLGHERMLQRTGGIAHRNMSRGRMSRILKKMTGRENWYKSKTSTSTSTSNNGDAGSLSASNEGQRGYWGLGPRPRPGISTQREHTGRHDPTSKPAKLEPRSIMFVPRTNRGELLNRLRMGEQKLGDIIGNKIKMVERGGLKLSAVLIKKKNQWGRS